ncbi:MAG: DDE-type integrase/transposase/recombinase [Aulosira sp. ZfuVER01]|nr:DDE-type integrase/transposase/recombinase [Aulosira sp. ZfuVER01]MDZ7997711.1 DDE-type integrase/transposase/recombinase [Aulosira sp. DedVER01a]MDZ8052206.1 DDE-type integrase/transposase/recombinase [Aulosira sp. ZfuCHP01]
MLSLEEFEALCYQLKFSNSTCQLIAHIRVSEPSRAVQGNYGNVCGNYCSDKMGRTIQFESHRGELGHIIENLEHGKEVLEYYDQPPAIELIYFSKTDRKVRTRHTPDFFVIENNWIGWEEFKPEEELLKLTEEQPNRYIQDEDGNWHCPPGEEYARKYGLNYRVRTSAEISPIRLRNWIWLEPYFQQKQQFSEKFIFQSILDQVQTQPGITYSQLLISIDSTNPDDLNWLIATEKIFINFDTATLAEPDKVRVFSTKELAQAYQENSLTITANTGKFGINTLKVDVGKSLSWDGEYWEITNAGQERVYLKRSDGKTTSLLNKEFDELFLQGHITTSEVSVESDSLAEIQAVLSRARPKDIQTANERYDQIKLYFEDDAPPITKVNRSIRRWRDRYREAEKLYGKGNGYLGLLPQHLDKGHHQKLDVALVAFMNEFIEENYFTATNRRITAVYRDFKEACKKHNPPFEPPSDKTFRLQIKLKNNYQLVKARYGSRVAKQSKPFHSTEGIPRNGDLPWENAHIDHTPLDVDLVSSLISLTTCNISSAISLDEIKLLGRCWATFMVDGYCKRILAVYLSFEEPSYRSCMMVIRICVQHFKRLPQTIVTDNGREFHSIYFKQLLAYYKCHHKYRPPGEPRYGNPVERVFGTTNTLWIHELQGNTQILQKRRQVTKAVNPKNQAVWTIGELYQSLEHWSYEIYDKREHSSLGQSPYQAYEIGIALGGRREMRRIDYDATLEILTLPSPENGDTRVVQPGRGIKINNIYYWCTEFRDPEVEKTSVDVKINPFNVGIVQAYVKGYWRECVSDHYQYLQGRTEKELKVISADLRQRKSGHAKRVEISDTDLIKHLQSAQALEGELLKSRLQALENRIVLDIIEGKNLSHPHRTVTIDIDAKTDAEESIQISHLEEDDPNNFEYYEDF